MSLSTCPRATDQRRTPSSPPLPINLANTSSQPPFLPTPASLPPHPTSTSAFQHPSRESRPPLLVDYSVPRSQAYPDNENVARYTPVNPGNDFDYPQWKRSHHSTSSSTGGSFPTTLPPPPTLPLPSIASSAPMLSLTPQLPALPLPPPISQSAANLRRLSSSQQPIGSRPPTASSNMGMSPIGGGGGGAGRMAFSPIRRNSNNDPASNRPLTSHTRQSSQSSIQYSSSALQGRRGSGGPKSKATVVNEEAASSRTLSPAVLKMTPSPSTSGPATAVAAMSAAAPVPVKSRRVRTGCLTCRERHLKCDENTPDCLNCRKGNRECKRGLRLNFIDIQTKPIPFVPPITEWNSRSINVYHQITNRA